MRVGTVREIKDNEYRVGMSPADVLQYVGAGHEVLIQKGAGVDSGFADEAYIENGAKILETAEEVWAEADMICKVKEPMGKEYDLMREEQIVFTYLHMAANKPLAEAMLKSKATGVAYETVTNDAGELPLLNPMSQIAGRLSIFSGATALERPRGGSGILLPGVPGVRSANVLIIGGGVVGSNAAIMAQGIGANVTLMDVNLKRLEELDLQFNSQIATLFSDEANIERYIKDADLVISTVLIPGAAAPKLVKKEHLKMMKKGSVIVDVAIDQGGSTEVSRPTTHSDPTYVVDDIVMYCVANMPGAVPYTSTKSLTNATIRYGLQLANHGVGILKENAHFRNGLNTYKGKVTNQGVASSLDLEYVDALDLL